MYDKNMFVAVGDSGVIITSGDSKKWTYRKSDTINRLSSAAYGNGTFVVVGDAGILLSSTNGVFWQSRKSGTTNLLRGVTYGNGMFLAVGEEGTILASTDGASWEQRPINISAPLTSITYGNGMFVTVAASGYGLVLTSVDGIKWTQGNGQGAQAVCYGNGVFVTAKSWGHPDISTNGVDWGGLRTPLMFTLHGVAFGNGIFVAVGRNQIVTSKDGNVWADLRPPPSRLLFGRPYDNGQNFMPIPLQNFGGLGFQGLHLIGSNTYARRNIRSQLEYADGDFDATKLSRFVVDPTPITGNVFGNQFCIVKGGIHGVLSTTDGVYWKQEEIARNNDVLLARSNLAPELPPSTEPVPGLSGQIGMGNGGFELTHIGEIGRVYRIQASTNLVTWVDIGIFTNAQTTTRFIDQDATNYPHRFYRVISP